ncbi:MAG TPA: plastocyanin/azurin family copper-binding protein [Gemmatimonadales bacterium]|nr:plastocyanin/azurin family copper-binding protein [Gemmatimonadales bacterium]
MRYTARLLVATLFSIAACGGMTSPGGGGGGGGGPVGQIVVGNIFFRSAHNGSQNPAVDTIAAGSTVTWTWNAAGSHSIQSTGQVPNIFRNSVVMNAANHSYAVTFQNPGTYPYDCAVHGAAMSGVIVVQ